MSTKNLKKLVIFDCDGTLVDSEQVAAEVYTKYWATLGIHLTEDEFKETFIGTGNDHPANIEMFKKMPVYAKEEGDQLWDEALEKNLQPVPGIKDLVTDLKCAVCVGSNSSRSHVQKALEKTKLNRYFGDNVFSASQVLNPKPSPDLFLHICNTLGMEIHNCIVIEDSKSGVQAAKNAGIDVVAFSGASHFIPSLRTNLNNQDPNWMCSNTEELREVLNQFGLFNS